MLGLCAFCQSETERHDGSTPVCGACSARHALPPQPLSHHAIYAALQGDVTEAAERASAANAAFREVMQGVPSELPHPDGTQRVLNVCNLLAAARREMTEADTRLHNFLLHGTVPAHLKR